MKTNSPYNHHVKKSEFTMHFGFQILKISIDEFKNL